MIIETKKILAIDYGEARIGLALADTEVKIASGFATLDNDNKFYEKIDEIIDKQDIKIIVIGTTTDPRGKRMKDADRLDQYLRQKDVEIEFQDEMFTTQEAQRFLKEKWKRNIKQHDNSEAARIILQDWLERSFR